MISVSLDEEDKGPDNVEMSWGIAFAVALGSLFLWAGLAKVRRSQALRGALIALGLPPSISAYASIAITILEIGAGTGLLLGMGEWIDPLAAILILGFAAASVLAITRRLHVSCGCFGQNTDELGVGSLVRSILMSLLLVGFVSNQPSALIGSDWQTATVALATGAVLVLGLMVAVEITELLAAAIRRAEH